MQLKQSEKSIALISTIAIIFAIAGLSMVSNWNHHFSFLSGEGTTITQDSKGNFNFAKRNADYQIQARCSGQLTLEESESDIATISPDGEWFMSEVRANKRREYRVKANSNGGLTRKFTVDGMENPIADEAIEWIRMTFLEVFRSSGFDAESRVQRLLVKGGVAAVLEEVRQLHGDHARAEYLSKLLMSTRLLDTEIAQYVECLKELKNDYELTRALNAVLDAPGPLAVECVTQVLNASEYIRGDFDRSEFLIHAIEKWGKGNDSTAWFKSLDGIDSDFEAAKALKVAAEVHPDDAVWLELITKQAARQIQSPYELRCVLQTVVAFADPLTKPTIGVLLNGIDKVDSNYEKSVVMKEIAVHVGGDFELEERFNSIANRLSPHERKQVLKQLKPH